MSDNEQQYTPTTAQIEVQFIRGSATKSATITKAQSEEFGGEFLRWLHQHDAQVRTEGAKSREEEIYLAVRALPGYVDRVNGTSGFDIGENSLVDVLRAIRAIPIPSTGAESETPAIDRLLAKNGHAPLAELLAVPSTGADAESDRLAAVRKKKIGEVRAVRASTGAENEAIAGLTGSLGKGAQIELLNTAARLAFTPALKKLLRKWREKFNMFSAPSDAELAVAEEIVQGRAHIRSMFAAFVGRSESELTKKEFDGLMLAQDHLDDILDGNVTEYTVQEYKQTLARTVPEPTGDEQ